MSIHDSNAGIRALCDAMIARANLSQPKTLEEVFPLELNNKVDIGDPQKIKDYLRKQLVRELPTFGDAKTKYAALDILDNLFWIRSRTKPTHTRFVPFSVLGSGGEGIVFHAWDRDHQREVALKFSIEEDQESALIGFKNDKMVSDLAKSTHKENTPLVETYSVEKLNGHAVMTSQVIEGKTLGDALKEHESSVEIVRLKQDIELFDRTIMQIQLLHDIGILHLDIKDGNILVDQSSNPLLIDTANAAGFSSVTGGAIDEITAYTTGILARDKYASPEQIKAHKTLSDEDTSKVTKKSDLYSFARILNNYTNSKLKIFKKSNNPHLYKLYKEFQIRWLNRSLDHDPTKRPTFTELSKALQELHTKLLLSGFH